MSTLGLSDRIAFYEELRRMVAAGFVLSQALRTLREKHASPGLAHIYQALETSCAAGRPLAEGLAEIPWDFGGLEVHLVRAGEGSGRLEEVLKSLADYFRRRQELLRRIQSALLYPVFLIHVAIFVCPLPMAFLDGWFAYVKTVCIELIVVYGAFAAGWGFTLLVRNVPGISHAWDRVRFLVPWYGPATKRFAITRFATTLGHLLDSGVTAPKSIELAADTLGVPTWRSRVLAAIPRVQAGERIVDSLDSAGFLPHNAKAILLAGEEAGQLPEVLLDVAKMTEEEGSHIARNGCKALSLVFLLFAILAAFYMLVSNLYLRLLSGMDQVGGN